LLVAFASCSDELAPETCPGDVPAVVTDKASACVVAVIETGFLCSGAWPYRYEYDGAVICADAPELSDEDLQAIMASHRSESPMPRGPSLSAPNGDAFAGIEFPDAGDRPGVPDANVHDAGGADSGRSDERAGGEPEDKPSTANEVAEERKNDRRNSDREEDDDDDDDDGEDDDDDDDDDKDRVTGSGVDSEPARGAGPPDHASASDRARSRWDASEAAGQTPE
jgi:hypothetical protein